MITAITAGVGSAALGGLGFVIQQQEAASQPDTVRLHPRLLLNLLRRPVWLLGLAAMVAGQILGGLALDKGGLGLVEPLLATNLMFALGIAAVRHRRRLPRREVLGAFLIAGGLAGFIVVASPGSGDLYPPWQSWLIAGLVLLGVVGGLLAWSRRCCEITAARTIGAAAGVTFGFQDALTRRTLTSVPSGDPLSVLHHWPTYVLIVVGACSIFLAQSAFEAGPLPASLPLVTFGEPLTGIAFGAAVYGEHLSLAPGDLAVELACLAAAAYGVWRVAGSGTLTASAGSGEP